MKGVNIMKELFFLFRNYSRKKTIVKIWANTSPIKTRKWKDDRKLYRHTQTKRRYIRENTRDSSVKRNGEFLMKNGKIGLPNVEC